MKRTFIRRTAFASVAILAVLSTGCASVAVTGDAIEKNTSIALGVPQGNFTISNRVDEGLKTNYTVNTNAGKQYSCYVTGTISYLGRQVSDAMCTEMVKSAASSPTVTAPAPASTASAAPASKGTCNALLKAAKKC